MEMELIAETNERKARILDAMRDAEMCVLLNKGRDKNPFIMSDPELEDVWNKEWEMQHELRSLRSTIVYLQEITKRHELRARGHNR